MLRITRLELSNFRNYTRFVLEPSPSLTVLLGPNAAGKTNAIEAIQLVTSTRSFRRPKLDQVVRWGSEGASVRLRAEDGPRLLETEMEIDAEGRRTYRVNGQTVRRFSEVAGLLPSVVFTPDDLDMAKGPAERRRTAIDDLGEQLSATYGSLRHDYGRVVRHRNALLKDHATETLMEAWDEQLVTMGAKLLAHRLRLLEKVMTHAAERYQAMAKGEELGFAYVDKCGLPPGGPLDQDLIERALRAELGKRRAEEDRRVTTLVGPHRDDIVFDVDGRNARTFASQGQQRTIALAWKLAEVEVVREVLREDPVLLLDDVMSELDAERRAALSQLVSSDIQTFITTTNTGYFTGEMLDRALMVEIPGEPA
jgi:DNA replication and repair protein RecF